VGSRRVRVAGEMLLGDRVRESSRAGFVQPLRYGHARSVTWLAGARDVDATSSLGTDHDAWGPTREGGNGRRGGGRRFGSRWAEPTESRASGEDKQVESEKGWA